MKLIVGLGNPGKEYENTRHNIGYIVVNKYLKKNGFSLNKDKFNGKLVFAIGGSYGFDENIRQRADDCISFSKMTFPHQLFRVLLLEQIYRAYKINNNESYHK